MLPDLEENEDDVEDDLEEAAGSGNEEAESDAENDDERPERKRSRASVHAARGFYSPRSLIRATKNVLSTSCKRIHNARRVYFT